MTEEDTKYPKITSEESEELLQRRIIKIDSDRNYAKELFKMYYKEPPKENLAEWKALDNAGKLKIVKQITKWEDRAFINQAQNLYGIFSVKKALSYVRELKHRQLVEYGIRK